MDKRKWAIESLVILVFPAHALESIWAWIFVSGWCSLLLRQSCSKFWRSAHRRKTTWLTKRKHYGRRSTSYGPTCYYFFARWSWGSNNSYYNFLIFKIITVKFIRTVVWVKSYSCKNTCMTGMKNTVAMWSLNSGKLQLSGGRKNTKKIANLFKFLN